MLKIKRYQGAASVCTLNVIFPTSQYIEIHRFGQREISIQKRFVD